MLEISDKTNLLEQKNYRYTKDISAKQKNYSYAENRGRTLR